MDTSQKMKYEDNPFENEVVAKEWINSVENERELIRDKETYPLIRAWAERVHPKIIVEIGSGQGIWADKVQLAGTRYIGIEPSQYLIERALALYSHPDREFVVGNAYNLSLADEIADAVLSVNVWFHLEDLRTASREMARILQQDGNFLVSTSNPDAYDVWESLYFDYTKKGKKIVGKANIPINPLSRNTFYQHTKDEIFNTLTANSLEIERIEEFGIVPKFKDAKLFINIIGKKSVSN